MGRMGFCGRVARWGVPLVALTLGGCGSGAQQSQLRNAELDRKVQELRAQSRRDRVKIRELERQLLDAQTGEIAVAPAPVAERPSKPSARRGAEPRGPAVDNDDVEVIFEDVGGVVDAPEDGREQTKVLGKDANGIEIRYAGAALAKDSVRPRLSNVGSGSRLASLDALPPAIIEDEERLPVTTGAVPKVAAQVAKVLQGASAPKAAPAPAAAAPSGAQASYQSAMDFIEAGDYAHAVSGMQAFLKQYPNHELADNAQYWIGESYYVQKQYSSALSAFRGVVDKFPLGNKVPDALLKVGYCLLQLGDTEAARRTLERVKTEFADTNPANLAARKLQEMK